MPGLVRRFTLKESSNDRPQSPTSPKKHRLAQAARKVTSRPALKLATVPNEPPLAYFTPVDHRPAQPPSKDYLSNIQLAHAALRSGKHEDGIIFFQKALDDEHVVSWRKFELLGMLGSSHARSGDFAKAHGVFTQCYNVAKQLSVSVVSECCVLEAQAGACWAAGNIGMANLQLFHTDPLNAPFLGEAIERFKEQIKESRRLQKRFSEIGIRLVSMQLGWAVKRTRLGESFGLNRLLLCHAAQGSEEMVDRIGEETCLLSETYCDREPATLSRFCYAYALASLGKRQRAIEQLGLLPNPSDGDASTATEDPWLMLDQAMQPAPWTGGLSHQHSEDHRLTPMPRTSTLDKLKASTPTTETGPQYRKKGGMWARVGMLLKGAAAFKKEPG